MTTPEVQVRNPSRRYSITLAEPAWHPVLAYLECNPGIEGATPEERRLQITRAGPFVQLSEAGCAAQNFASIGDLRDHLHGRFFIESMAGDKPLLHAACLLRNQKRILLVGPKNAGKSTLSLALALSGYAIEGDENVFITAAGVTARPRACRVKESSFAVLPELAKLAAAAPFITDFHGRKIYNISPDLLGSPWRIATGPADVVILLHANHGAMSSIRRLPPLILTRALMSETAFPAKNKASGIAAIAAMASTAIGFDLSVGSLDTAIANIDCVLRHG